MVGLCHMNADSASSLRETPHLVQAKKEIAEFFAKEVSRQQVDRKDRARQLGIDDVLAERNLSSNS